jgi:hypothetical protein
MVSNLRAFLDQTYVDRLTVLFLFLFQLDRSCQASNTSAHNNDVVLHLLAGRQFGWESENNVFLGQRRNEFLRKYSDHWFWIKNY